MKKSPPSPSLLPSSSPWLSLYTHEGCFYYSMCHNPLPSLFYLMLKLFHVCQGEPFHASHRALWCDPIHLWVLRRIPAGDVPGSPVLPAPAWNQRLHWVLSVPLSAEKQLCTLSPGSSHNLILLPPCLLSHHPSLQSTDGSLSLAASGEKVQERGRRDKDLQ